MPANCNRDVLQSPAVPLLCRLEAEGFDLWIDEDRLIVRPVSRLDEEFRRQLKEHKSDLLMLLRVCDARVQDRRLAFVAALESGARADTLVLRAGVPYVAGTCYSCGEKLDRPAHGKCWRCALAWRLAQRFPIAPELAAVYDGQRRVA